MHLDEYHEFLLILPLLMIDITYRKDHANLRETAKQNLTIYEFYILENLLKIYIYLHFGSVQVLRDFLTSTDFFV